MTTFELPATATAQPRRTLSRRASFWTAAAVAGISLWTSAAPTTTYPLYASTWHLTPTATTAIFAVYPVVLVVFLLIFGQLSDYIGRRATMLYGVGALLAGVLLFAIAPSVGWVYAGRALMGAGVGLALTPATAAAVEFSAHGKAARASSITTAATAAGLALATIVGGGLIEYAPAPLHLDFWVLLAVIVGRLRLRLADAAAHQGREPRPLAAAPDHRGQGHPLLYVASAARGDRARTRSARSSWPSAPRSSASWSAPRTSSSSVCCSRSSRSRSGSTAIVGRRFPAGRLVPVGAVAHAGRPRSARALGHRALAAAVHRSPRCRRHQLRSALLRRSRPDRDPRAGAPPRRHGRGGLPRRLRPAGRDRADARPGRDRVWPEDRVAARRDRDR